MPRIATLAFSLPDPRGQSWLYRIHGDPITFTYYGHSSGPVEVAAWYVHVVASNRGGVYVLPCDEFGTDWSCTPLADEDAATVEQALRDIGCDAVIVDHGPSTWDRMMSAAVQGEGAERE